MRGCGVRGKHWALRQMLITIYAKNLYLRMTRDYIIFNEKIQQILNKLYYTRSYNEFNVYESKIDGEIEEINILLKSFFKNQNFVLVNNISDLKDSEIYFEIVIEV